MNEQERLNNIMEMLKEDIKLNDKQIKKLEKYFVKAKCRNLDSGATMDLWVKGLLIKGPDNDFYADTCENNEPYIWIDFDTVCRNTGIQIRNEYLYEFDIIEIAGRDKEIYYVYFDDYQKKYTARQYESGNRELFATKIINNLKNESGANLIYQQYERDKAKPYLGRDTSDCQSRSQRNKVRW